MRFSLLHRMRLLMTAAIVAVAGGSVSARAQHTVTVHSVILRASEVSTGKKSTPDLDGSNVVVWLKPVAGL